MNQKTRFLTHAAIIATLYVALSYMQNLLIPDTTSFAIQFRASEALCVLALFSPAAIPGLSLGCFLYNFCYAAALPLDAVVGMSATFLAVGGMYWTRNLKICKYPLLSMTLPALFNGILIGWELSVYIGGAFLLNAFYVAVGELLVLLTLGSLLYFVVLSRKLHRFFR